MTVEDFVFIIEAFEVLVGLALIGGICSILVFGLLRAGSLRPSVSLIISLSLLTMVSLIGFAVTQTTGEQSTELATLAGMGFGALAGAVTAVWSDQGSQKTPKQPEPDIAREEPEPLNEEPEVQGTFEFEPDPGLHNYAIDQPVDLINPPDPVDHGDEQEWPPDPDYSPEPNPDQDLTPRREDG